MDKKRPAQTIPDDSTKNWHRKEHRPMTSCPSQMPSQFLAPSGSEPRSGINPVPEIECTPETPCDMCAAWGRRRPNHDTLTRYAYLRSQLSSHEKPRGGAAWPESESNAPEIQRQAASTTQG